MGQRQKALDRILPLLTTSHPDAPSSVTELRAGGASLTESGRAELLAKALSGELVEVEVDVLAYEQSAQPNRKFVRFRDGLMSKLAASGKGTPVLRDHEQGNMLAKGGVVVASRVEKRGDGDYAIMQTHKLMAPWAVELAARGLLDRVSIGWNPTGPITCSACSTEVFTECYHLPGDRVAEDGARASGGKRFVRKADGPITVQWVFTDAELIETSHVPIPAVKGAGVEQIRATLSLDFPEIAETDPPPVEPEPEASSVASQDDPQQEPDMPGPTLAPQTPAPEPAPQVDPAEVQRLASAQVAAKLADVATLRSFAERVKFDPARAQELVLAHPTLDAAKAAMLTELAAKVPEITPVHSGGLVGGEDERDKTIKLAAAGILSHIMPSGDLAKALKDDRLSGVRADDSEVRRLSRMSLMDLGAELLEKRGVSYRQLRGLDPVTRAKAVIGLPVQGLSNTSDDFPIIADTVVNVGLKQRFEERRSEWKRVARREDLKDFKSAKFIGAGNFPAFLDVVESGTYQRGSFTESDFELRLGKAGRIVSWTWELMLADDFNMIERIIADAAIAAMRYEDRKFLAKLLANKLPDGSTDFFSSGNGNICGTTGTPSASVLKAAFKALARQRGEPGITGEVDADGEYAVLRPALWMLGSDDLTDAEQLLGPNYMPTSAANAPTDRMRRLRDGLIEEPTLDDQSPVFSVLFTDPAILAAVQYGYLRGEGGPVFERQMGFTTDGFDFKGRLAFYVEFVEPRAALKIPRSG